MVRELHELIRENTKDQAEYKRYVEGMKSSILTSFYTPEPLVEAISKALTNVGIRPGRLLDPSAGGGIFPEYLAAPDNSTEVYCVEQDPLTSRVLAALNPDHRVINDGFQNVGEDMDGYFDIVASNIPFGNFRVFDMSFDRSKDRVRQASQNTIHNYFFVKGLDTLREGGLLAFITSQGVMNSPANASVRAWLMQNSDLVSAIRLPNNAFKENAGTEVGTDLIVLQKRSGKTALAPHEQDFIETQDFAGVNVNKYYKDLSRFIQTSVKPDKDMYGKPAIVVEYDGTPEQMASELWPRLTDDLFRRFDKALYYDNMAQNASQVQEPIDIAAEVIEEPETQMEYDHRQHVTFAEAQDEQTFAQMVADEIDSYRYPEYVSE